MDSTIDVEAIVRERPRRYHVGIARGVRAKLREANPAYHNDTVMRRQIVMRLPEMELVDESLRVYRTPQVPDDVENGLPTLARFSLETDFHWRDGSYYCNFLCRLMLGSHAKPGYEERPYTVLLMDVDVQPIRRGGRR